MATVTSQLTRIHDLEGSPTFASIGGGPGAGANTDIFLQASQSGARRQSNAVLHGFWLDDGVGNNLSAAGTHVGMWIFHTHYAVLTALQMWLGDSTANYDQHAFPLVEYPDLGGWVRIWVEVARTPDAIGGSGSTGTAVRFFGLVASLPAVGGTSPNLNMDAIDHTTTGLLLTGTAGVFSDFVTADASVNNRYGVLLARAGVLYCLARIVLGSSSSLAFDDNGFVLIFPNQSLVATDFMGITIDLQNAATSVALRNGVIRSASTTRQGDIQVSGTAGTLLLTALTLANLRTINLTAATTLELSALTACDKLNQNGATIDDCTISGATTADGEAFIISDDPGQISNCTFIFSDGHAIEMTTPGTFPFAGNVFQGYGADGTNDAAIYNNSGGLVTLNITGAGVPTVRNGPGASTVLNAAVSVTVTPLATGSEVRAYQTGTNIEVDGVETSTGSSHVLSLIAGQAVDIVVLNYGPPIAYEPARFENQVFTVDQNFNPVQRIDRNFAA